MTTHFRYIQPNWPAPQKIRAFSTTRIGGCSKTPYNSLNLGYKSGDDSTAVTQNRLILQQELQFPETVAWLNQVSGNNIIDATTAVLNPAPTADASFAAKSNIVCCVMTADCLPILLCDRAATVIAAIHAGWRGIASGIIEATIKQLPTNPENLLAWLGPAIGPTKFEVGAEVREIFIKQNAEATAAFVQTKTENKFLANIYLLAQQRLNSQNVTAIYGGEYCTYSQEELFFSHRRDQGKTGRMASGIWLAK